MGRPARLRDFDWLLLSVALTIAGVGVLEIFSTTEHSALAGEYKKHIAWTLAGALLALIVSRVDYRSVLDYAPWLYAATLVGLVVVLVAGHSVAKTHRWLSVGGLTFQVSEMAKLVIIVAVAGFFAARGRHRISWLELALVGIGVGLPMVLIAVEPDLGTALTLLPIAGVAVFLGGIRARQLLVLCLLGALAAPAAWHFMRPYQRQRLMTFVHPSKDSQGSGYQVTQSRIAIGSGGFWGKGIGNGSQSQLGFIPVSHADFIFAAFAEEQGFVGTVCVLLLYLALLLRLLDGAHLAEDPGGMFLIVGLASVLFFQVAVNIGMMIGFLPTTGIPLPLMSQGGSSVLFTFLGLGLAMSVRMRRFVY